MGAPPDWRPRPPAAPEVPQEEREAYVRAAEAIEGGTVPHEELERRLRSDQDVMDLVALTECLGAWLEAVLAWLLNCPILLWLQEFPMDCPEA